MGIITEEDMERDDAYDDGYEQGANDKAKEIFRKLKDNFSVPYEIEGQESFKILISEGELEDFKEHLSTATTEKEKE